MPSIINSNVNSLQAQTNLTRSQASLSTSIQRLSSGLRINSSADDAAGYAIAQGFTAQINGTNQAIRNANDGVSLAQTAGGALNQVTSDLQRIRQLAVQSANATNSASDRAALQQEVSQLVGDITSIGSTTSFNGLKVLDGSYSNQQFQVGANVGNTINVSVGDARATALGANSVKGTNGVNSTVDLTTGITVNGTSISTASATSLDDVVSAVNAQVGTTGVTATRSSDNINTFTYTATTAAETLTINGVDIAVASGATATQLNDAINAKSAQTGVSASFAGTTFTLTSANGGDLTIKATAVGTAFATDVNGIGADDVGATALTYKASIDFSTPVSKSAPTIAGTFGTALAVGAAVVYQLSGMDVSTSSNAQNALKTIDFALQQVASSAAQLGAVQNRFTATIANLQTASTNLSSSRSAIQDADFAAETANLSRSQVLQQAGTAILAQANQIPNTVLSLLR